MWSFFSRTGQVKEFPFEVGQKVNYRGEVDSVFELHDGKRKDNGESVSIFIFNKKGRSESDPSLIIARSTVKRLRSLRHPCILTYIDSLEDANVIYLVTERVDYVLNYLNEISTSDDKFDHYITWGLLQVLKAVLFLIKDANTRHNNLHIGAVFVNEAGEWKLGEFGYCSDITGPFRSDSTVYSPPEVTGSERVPSTSSWAVDSWGFGIIIYEVYNGRLTRKNELHKTDNIPPALLPTYCELVAANPAHRPHPSDIISKSCEHGNHFNNYVVYALTFLEELHLKEKLEVDKFLNDLLPLLDKFPKNLLRRKIVPNLIKAYEFDSGVGIIPPFLKIAEECKGQDFQDHILPGLVKLYNSTERVIRFKLLSALEHYVDDIPSSVLNDTIFPKILLGFMDGNPAIRELTVKAMVHLAPKLNSNNLNNEVLKYFSIIQAQEQVPLIRVNTIICLGKISQYLEPSKRNRILAPALMKALQDTYVPTKTAAILGLAATHQYYPSQLISHRILPALCPLCTHPDQSVRENTFRTVKGFVNKLDRISQGLDTESHDVTSPTNTASTWAEWAVKAITSKFSHKGIKLEEGEQMNKKPNSESGDAQSKSNMKSPDSELPQKTPELDLKPNSEKSPDTTFKPITNNTSSYKPQADSSLKWNSDRISPKPSKPVSLDMSYKPSSDLLVDLDDLESSTNDWEIDEFQDEPTGAPRRRVSDSSPTPPAITLPPPQPLKPSKNQPKSSRQSGPLKLGVKKSM